MGDIECPSRTLYKDVTIDEMHRVIEIVVIEGLRPAINASGCDIVFHPIAKLFAAIQNMSFVARKFRELVELGN